MPAARGRANADNPASERVAKLLSAAAKKAPASEAELAAAARALAAGSAAVRGALAEVAVVTVKRGEIERPLYGASIQALAEAGDARVAAPLVAALSSEGAGGLLAIAAAAFTRSPALSRPLDKLVGAGHTHLAFAADVARVARGESAGAPLASLAPKLKEEYRISLCRDVFMPLREGPPLTGHAAAALAVLRGAERHVGRWLVFGEVAQRGGDMTPREDATARARAGASSSRVAWGLVAWALGAEGAAPARTTLDVLARLSDRPSGSRDVSFLFRMAAARLPSVRPVLESVARETPAGHPAGLRASFYLARDFGRDDARAVILATAQSATAPHRGLAAALLFDLGELEQARAAFADVEAESEPSPLSLAWLGLLSAAAPVVSDRAFRALAGGSLGH